MHRAAIRWLAALSALFVPATAPAQPVGYTLEKLVASGEPVPGGGATYYWFWDFDLDETGRVAVSAWMLSPMGGDVVAIHDGVGGQAIARSGDAVPGFSGESLGLVAFPFFGADALAWAGGWLPEAWVGRGLFVREGGVDTLRAFAGQAAPGGGSFATIEQTAMNDAKDVLFHSEVDAIGSGMFAIFLSRPGGLEQVVRNGDSAPTPVGGIVDGSQLSYSALAGDGSVAFASAITGGSASSAVFLRAPGGSLSTLLQQGDAALTPGGGTFEYFGYQVAMNDAHDVALLATVLRPGDPNPRRGLYVIGAAGHREVIVEGDVLPGTGGQPLSIFGGHFTFAMNDQGDVAFIARTLTREGLFVKRGSTLYPVAFEGQTVPGMPGERFRYFDDVRINEAGQVAFSGSTNSREGVFLATPFTPEISLAPPWALAALGVALFAAAHRFGRRSRP